MREIRQTAKTDGRSHTLPFTRMNYNTKFLVSLSVDFILICIFITKCTSVIMLLNFSSLVGIKTKHTSGNYVILEK